jgi:hypothetical protein
MLPGDSPAFAERTEHNPAHPICTCCPWRLLVSPGLRRLVSVALIVINLAADARALPYTVFYAVPNFLPSFRVALSRPTIQSGGRLTWYNWSTGSESNRLSTPLQGEPSYRSGSDANLLAAYNLCDLSRRNFFCDRFRHPSHHTFRNIVVVFVKPTALNAQLPRCLMQILFRVWHRDQVPLFIVENLHVSPKLGGDDGIRTRDLSRDRGVC